MLRRGVTDSSPAVRERTLRGISSLPALWSGRAATTLLALGPGRRHARPAPAGPARWRTKRPGFWSRPDALEHLKRLLVDPDAQVRELALSVVERNRLLAGHGKRRQRNAGPGPARQGARRRPGPASRALWTCSPPMESNPRTVVADVELGRPRLLSFSTFRKKVNPLFYQAGDDQQACANCHGNHTILRIAEAEPGTRPADASSSS